MVQKNGEIAVSDRGSNGRFVDGNHAGKDRPRGKSLKTRVRDVTPKAVTLVCNAVEQQGDVNAAAALLQHQAAVWSL
ncbi:MAG: hypothetical protein AB8F34_16155 [Akkermansiaceae bacterium]